MVKLAADDFALTTAPIQKITGHQLSELNQLAQNREDWRQLVVDVLTHSHPTRRRRRKKA